VVTETWPPEVNGVSLSLHRLVEEMRNRSHPIQLVRLRQPHELEINRQALPSDELLLRGLPIPRYPGLQMGLPALRALGKTWRKDRPDLVHIATEGPLGWSASRIARRLGLPVTSDFRTHFEHYSAHYGLGLLKHPIKRYLRRFHNRTRVTFVPTHSLKDELASEGFERLEVLGRGIDTERFDPARRLRSLRESWGVSDHEVVILCVGRLAPEKNLVTLIDAYRRLRADSQAVRLVLVGKGPLYESLRTTHPDIILTGQRTGLELAEHYASADVFAFASLTETFGNVILEAMASGLPVVAFGRGAAIELIVAHYNGLLANQRLPETFAVGIGELVRNPDLRARLGAMARQTALAHGWPAIAERFEQMLRQSIVDPSGAPT
jgi:glycosyltransferase involved in cell wall biosynthesis